MDGAIEDQANRESDIHARGLGRMKTDADSVPQLTILLIPRQDLNRASRQAA